MTELDQLEEIFCQALERPAGLERNHYLELACQDSPGLLQQVHSLLESSDAAVDFMEQPLFRLSSDDGVGTTDSGFAAESSSQRERTQPFQPRGSQGGESGLGTLGTYEILECIGRGGTGTVYRAFDPKLQRIVAIKALNQELANDPTARKRFEREARSAAAVNHPNVVSTYAVDDHHNPPFLVMEYVHGQSLSEKLTHEGMLSTNVVLRIAAQIAEGLVAAHKQGLIHRDIKPGNVMLENGMERVKLTDFGLARAVDDVELTRFGELFGTPQYMSPEQAAGGRVDHRTDLFSLGTVLYTMCTGRGPFRSAQPVETLQRIRIMEPRPVQESNPEIPEELCAVITKLLQKDPQDRYQSAAEVADVLLRLLARQYQGTASDLAATAKPRAASLLGNETVRRWLMFGLGFVTAIGACCWWSSIAGCTSQSVIFPAAMITMTLDRE